MIELARSTGVWGVVSARVSTVRVQDSTRPDGVAAAVSSLSTGSGTAAAQVFVAQVSSGPVTITAYDGSGIPLGTTQLR